MVTLTQVQETNSTAGRVLPPDLVAVFSGATTGIGALSMRAFARYAVRPRIYFVGRSQEQGSLLVKEMDEANSGGHYVFIKADLSLMSNVDRVCEEIKEKEKAVNLLFMTQGTLKIGQDTSEGLPYMTSVVLYSRFRMASNLLVSLRRASTLRRIISVYAGGKEGTLYVDDIGWRQVPLSAAQGHLASVMTLGLASLAREAPDVSFIHAYPGFVKTDLIRAESGWIVRLLGLTLRTMLMWKWISQSESGERHAFLCTSGMYPPQKEADAAFLPPSGSQEVATGWDGEAGSGVYIVDEYGESASRRVVELLQRYRTEGAVEKVWAHFRGEFERISTLTRLES